MQNIFIYNTLIQRYSHYAINRSLCKGWLFLVRNIHVNYNFWLPMRTSAKSDHESSSLLRISSVVKFDF